MHGYPQFSLWISITVYISFIIIKWGKNTFELVGTILKSFVQGSVECVPIIYGFILTRLGHVSFMWLFISKYCWSAVFDIGCFKITIFVTTCIFVERVGSTQISQDSEIPEVSSHLVTIESLNIHLINPLIPESET